MTPTNRQELIAGWNQSPLRQACVVIVGETEVARQCAWGMQCLGIGGIIRVGHGITPLDHWLADGRLPGSLVTNYKSPVQSKSQLAWMFEGEPVRALVITTGNDRVRTIAREYAQANRIFWLFATADSGGFLSSQEFAPVEEAATESVVVAQCIAGLAIDQVRKIIAPLPGDVPSAEGKLGWKLPSIPRHPVLMNNGVGGIGCFNVYDFAALGFSQYLVDADVVEPHNLNRQGLFTLSDATANVPKALAARRSLQALFPGCRIKAQVRRIDATELAVVKSLRCQPGILVSALDNAATRLIVAAVGQELGLPVVQGGTSAFAADCITQVAGGRSLDEQLHGAMSLAVERELSRELRRGCAAEPSYVVPSMICGALVARRVLETCYQPTPRPPIRWRAGEFPREDRSLDHDDYFSRFAG
jgi:ThiF family